MTQRRKPGQGMVWVRGHTSWDEDVAGLCHICLAHGVPGQAEPLDVIEVR